ncbi:polymorphic toxin-type HINT domain-containing protein [Streptomyces sp. A3M-1-3]|uniref:polymorphic toxin-type HINT domain-containing protein n=1 Tax=Streptomyces sp. A3M-1-3 TaxID=2962044 RepID=UPI0020B78D90|nr:polymorphic toxin-type HINT domain-containing protein [Streptomyces sp. A3M-1-3]MCP3820476.1 polymorphic toxin-type HINT domain-containing protein [Streptomyces sp. A3M-1-3]
MPVVSAALLVALLPVQALALPPDPAKDEVPREELVLEELPDEREVSGGDHDADLERIEAEAPENQNEAPAGTATQPAADTGSVTFGTPVQPAALTTGAASADPAAYEPVEDLPVKLGQAPGGAMPTGTWTVDIAAPTAAVSDGVDGAVVTVTAPVTGSVPISVQLGYQAYQNLYGADWSSRLKFVQFPECYLATPDLEECQAYEELETVNDAKTKTITATVDTAADGTVAPVSAQRSAKPGSGVMQATYVQPAAAGGDRAVVGAVDSGAGEGGSFKATPLISNGHWSAGSSSGAFTWSYPVAVPPVAAGPAPRISLDYNSQAVDGRTASSSPQSSWVGEGWDYDPGHIERRYRTCQDDREATDAGPPNNPGKKDKTGDLCWVSYNAVMSLGGKTTELVRVDADTYRPQSDDGTRVELKTGGDNGDNNGEHWIVTTPDGTKYYYGLNKIGDGHADTKSVFTVPVFGNHPGEPCYASTFAASRCNNDTNKQQAWQWGLDKVVDVHGNAMIVNWHQSTNYYAVNEKYKTPEKYIRGGLPDLIEYGLRDDNLGGTPSAKIDFVLQQRCLQSAAACESAKFDITDDPASYRPWWDSPGNLNCKSTSKLCPSFPSFWNRMRLGGITTYAHRPGGTAPAKVDTYLLNHAFPRDWYNTSPGLWLNSITRYGFTPGATSGTLMSEAGVSFHPYVVDPSHPLGSYLKDKQLPNLVPRNSSDPRPGFTRPRIGAVSTEHGGDIEVIYKGGCKVQPTVAPENNHGTCYPVRWSPDGEVEKPALAWFNKYVVHAVTETDKITGVSKTVTTQYDYANAAWAKGDDEFTKPELRTHNEWRGYQKVTTRKGAKNSTPTASTPQAQSYAVTRYFRGAGGPVKDSTGTITLVEDDDEQYAGMVAETITHAGAGGRELKRTLNFPWSKQTASRERAGGVGPLLAHRSGMKRSDAIQNVGSSWQAIRTEAEVDTVYGLPIQVQTAVVKPNGTGETLSNYTCAKTQYVHNTSANLIGLPKEARTTATSCADYDSAVVVTYLLNATRTSYDGLAHGATPVKGLVTATADTNATGSAYSVVTSMTYDPLGRLRTVERPVVGTTETRYTPGDAGGPVTSITTINPKGHTNVTSFDPGRGLPLTVTDTNGRVARNEYDAFGRLVKGWSPARSSGTQEPDVKISYQLANAEPTVTRPSAVTLETIKDDGTYAKQVTIYDGLMRAVQTQSEAHGPGRIITDTRYDDHGLVSEQTGGYLAKGEPQPVQFKRVSDTLVPSLTRTRFDGLERPVRVATYHGGEFAYDAARTYGDTNTSVRPPGATYPRVNTWTDALGRVTKIDHNAGASSPQWRTTTYGYDTRGNRDKVTDPAGNVWSYTFDTRRRLTESTDPDTGTVSAFYDDADRMVRTSDVRGSVYTTYDELNRITGVREGTATAPLAKEFTYDTLPGAAGLPVASIRHDASGDYINRVTGYDTGYRPTGSQTVIPANAMTTGVSGTYTYTHTYTPTGKPLTTTLPAKGGLAAEKVITRYNGDGLPESTSGASWYTTDATYSAYGEPLRTVSGPQPYRVWTTNFVNEHTGQLQRTVVDRETANSHRINDDYYSYDLAGNITSQARRLTDGAVSTWDNQCYTYDAMNELVHAWTSNITPTKAGVGCKSADGTAWGNRTDGAPSRGPIANAPDTVSDTETPDAALTSSLNGAAPASGTVSGGSTGYWDSYTFDVIGNRKGLVKHNPADATKDIKLTYGYGTTVPANGALPSYKTQPHALAYVSSTPAGSGSVYEYDTAGNTKLRDLPNTTQNLKWTRENKLDTITDDGVTTKYVYDAEGNRVLENSPSGSVLYLGETELTTAAGQIKQATRAYTQDGAPTVIRSASNGATTGHKLTVLLTDHLGTATTTVEQTSGQPVLRRAFKPYGDVRGTKPASWPNKRSYLGNGIDDPSGLTHIGAREYDQAAGRFISVDPIIDIADPLQMNGYAYSNNNPTSSSDPSGLFCDGCGSDPGTVWTPDNGPGCTTEGCYDRDGDKIYDVSSTPSPTPSPQQPNVTVTQTADGRVWIENIQVPTAQELAVQYAQFDSAEERLKRWAQGKCHKPSDQGSAFCQSSEAMGLVSYEQSAFDKVVTAVIVGVVAPDIEAWKGCLGQGKMSSCGAAALDLPWAKVLKGFKVVGKVAETCGNSFTAGALVLMADGSTTRIEEIKPGDKVVATDPDTGKTRIEKVTAVHESEGQKNLVRVSIDTDGDRGKATAKVTATEGHPFWVPELGEWLDATDLISGQWLRTSAGTLVQITAVERWTQKAAVYNLTVSNIHTYYVLAGETPVLVHNSNCDLPEGYTSSPALKGDPYHPDSVAARSAQNRELYAGTLKDRAGALGYGRRIAPQKAPFNSHGQDVFFNGKNYITPDVDGHNVSGGWKVFSRRGDRIGTYDADLNYLKN